MFRYQRPTRPLDQAIRVSPSTKTTEPFMDDPAPGASWMSGPINSPSLPSRRDHARDAAKFRRVSRVNI